MFSCMNRILGSKWVDDTITPSDLHAPAPRLWCALQICPHLERNLSEQNIIFVTIIFNPNPKFYYIQKNKILYFTYTQRFSVQGNIKANKIFHHSWVTLACISTTMCTLFWTLLEHEESHRTHKENISAELGMWFFLIYSLSVQALAVSILTSPEVMLRKMLLSLQWEEKGKGGRRIWKESKTGAVQPTRFCTKNTNLNELQPCGFHTRMLN